MNGESISGLAVDFTLWFFIAYLWLAVTVAFCLDQRQKAPDKQKRFVTGFVLFWSALLFAALQIYGMRHR